MIQFNQFGEVPAFRKAEAGTPASPKANAARIINVFYLYIKKQT